MAARAAQALHAIADREKVEQFLKQHKESLQVWVGVAACVVLVFYLFSDGDFSFVLTLSSMLSMFSFLMVLVNIHVHGSTAGVSLRMNECYLLVSLARLCSILPFDGYLPFDKSGDWIYRILEVLICVCTGAVVYLCRVRHAASYSAAKDAGMNHHGLIAGCFLFALLFHPSLNDFPPTDVAWAFGLYLESVASLPQLFMFQQEDQIQPFMTHFLAGQTISRALQFMFWLFSYSELNNPAVLLKSCVGYWVMLVQFFQLLLMGDFMYHYLRCIKKGVSVSNLLNVSSEEV